MRLPRWLLLRNPRKTDRRCWNLKALSSTLTRQAFSRLAGFLCGLVVREERVVGLDEFVGDFKIR